MKATVVTIRTTTQPGSRTFMHTLVIAGNRARSSDELDRWRLYDLKSDSVTFVDEVAQTRRTEKIADLVRQKLLHDTGPLPYGAPRATFSKSGTARAIAGVTATRAVVRAGAYLREIWVGQHPAIPPRLFSMMVASDPAQSQLAPVMRDVDAALISIRGFPLAEHAELPYLDRRLSIDRTVVAIESRNVPEAFLQVPAQYRELASLFAPKPSRPRLAARRAMER